MMVKPTVTELLEKVEDRYALVAITSKRARQISNGDSVLTNAEEKSPVTLAAIEISEDKVKQVEE
ncbi:MAG: DNA-directed RNA polymerase subunit omega [Candidatus Scatovivens sp.]